MPGHGFGPRLRELRRKANVTLKALAAAVGRSVPYVSEIEIGRRRPFPYQPEVYSAIATALKLSRADLDELVQLALAERAIRVDDESAIPDMAEKLQLYRRIIMEASPEQLTKITEILKPDAGAEAT